MSIKISVQICSYNRSDLLRRSLEALCSVDFPHDEYEVLVVDDGSTDNTGEMVQSLNPPCKLTYIRQEKEGLSAGRNKGIRKAVGEVVLFVDDDTFAHRNLLKEHWASHQESDRYVVSGWVNHTDNPETAREPQFKMADYSTSFFWTSNVSVRRKYLLEVGLFDEEFTEYGWEDLELGHRLKNIGLEKKYNPKAIVFHYKKRWRASDLPRLCKQAESSGRSALIYLRKRNKLSTKMSTGVFPLRIMWNRVLKSTRGLCEWIVSKSGDKPLSGIPLLCTRTIVSFHYFDSVEKGLAAQKAAKRSETSN